MISTLLHLGLRDLGVYILYDRVVYFGGLEAPILYMTLMYYDVSFFALNEKIFMMIDYLLYLHV